MYYMEMNFCRRCGTQLRKVSDKVITCTNGHTLFVNHAPAVGIFFITSDNRVVLSKRGIEPHKGMLDAFGGFLDLEETLEQAVVRELTEETGLGEGDYETPRYLCSAVGHYPYQGEVLPVISSLYWTRLKPGKSITPTDDVADAMTLPLAEIDPSLLHDDDIRQGIATLQKLLL